MRVENLLVIDRSSRDNPGLLSPSQSKGLSFSLLGSHPCPGRRSELASCAALARCGDTLVDMRPEMGMSLPVMKGKGLFSLSNLSRALKYSVHGCDELQVLFSLFSAYS